jgi:diaminopimelate epimerase
MPLRFWKMHSVGNDFVLVDGFDVGPGADLPALSRKLSERRFGVGSDGLLVAWPEQGYFAMRMFNPDGSEDFCGNGMRCASLHAHLEGWIGAEGTVLHGGQNVRAEVSPDGRVTTLSKPASFDPALVPIQSAHEFVAAELAVAGRSYRAWSLSTGSTHTVLLVDRLPDDEEFFGVSPAIEEHRLFPQRTSVMWTQAVSPNEVRLRIWERGAGETLGCGTGSAAAAVVWARESGASGSIAVVSPGGTTTVELGAWDGPIRVTTEPVRVFGGVCPCG